MDGAGGFDRLGVVDRLYAARRRQGGQAGKPKGRDAQDVDDYGCLFRNHVRADDPAPTEEAEGT